MLPPDAGSADDLFADDFSVAVAGQLAKASQAAEARIVRRFDAGAADAIAGAIVERIVGERGRCCCR